MGFDQAQKSVLVLGNGGREAALAWALSRSQKVSSVYLFPTHSAADLLSEKIDSLVSTEDQLKTLMSLKTQNLAQELMTLCQEKKITFIVAGSESYMESGLCDYLRAAGLSVFAPTQMAARLETSKAFAKEVMMRAKIPTAKYFLTTSLESAKKHLQQFSNTAPPVLKVDELAAGKGVLLPSSIEEAQKGLEQLFNGTYLGKPIQKCLLEERLTGPECSVFALCSGEDYVWMGAAQDHKRLLDGDQGPNTGGMGAMTLKLTIREYQELAETILKPLLEEMKKAEMPYCGFLYLGLMRTPEGFKVIEFNVRLGDPETQALMPLMPDHFFEALELAEKGDLHMWKDPLLSESESIHVVVAAENYPGVEGKKIPTGDEVEFKTHLKPRVMAFPAGLKRIQEKNKKDRFVTSGGRVYGITSWGKDKAELRREAYEHLMNFRGAQWRTDIAKDWT
jgi:phosphoribosylamine--glycine ligase